MTVGQHEHLRLGPKGIYQDRAGCRPQGRFLLSLHAPVAAEICPGAVSELQRMGRGLPGCSGVM